MVFLGVAQMKTKIRRIILIIKTQFMQHCHCKIGNARMTPMNAKTRDDILKNAMHTTHSKIRRVTRSLILCVMFCRSFFVLLWFSFGHCVVYPSIYDF
jgi:hypothetical protein